MAVTPSGLDCLINPNIIDLLFFRLHCQFGMHLGRHRNAVGRFVAFTVVELLVVIAIIANLASLLLPALQRAKVRARTVQCLKHQKQFGYAWLMYSIDNAEHIPPNDYYSGKYFRPEGPTWVYGWLDNDDLLDWSDNTNYMIAIPQRVIAASEQKEPEYHRAENS